MPKAEVVTSGGAKVTIHGSTEEVAAILAAINGAPQPPPKARETPPLASRTRVPSRVPARATPTTLITGLIEEGFFKKPQELGAIKRTLEERGHYYPVTSISPIVLRLVRRRVLRRIKDQKRWMYVS